jgi:Flp pilus assembly protein TadG
MSTSKRPATRGIAMVEFAIMLPLILLLMAGVLDYTLIMRTAISVADAARAGAQYGSLSATNASDVTGMRNAALAAAPDVKNITASAATTCKCSDGTTINCTGLSCSSGPVRVYAQVTVSATATPIFSYSQVPFAGNVTTTVCMRAQ